MAVFNPDVPDAQPTNFMGWSKTIDQPKANEAGKYTGEATRIALSGVGEALDSAVRIADTYMKDGIIKPRIQAETDQLQNQYQDELNAKKASLVASGVSTAPVTVSDGATGTSSGMDSYAAASPEDQKAAGMESLIFAPPTVTAPRTVEKALDDISKLQTSKDQGKTTETAYYGDLNARLKALRAQYPGYREYIDSETSKITGVDSANALIKSTISEINNATQRVNADVEKDLAEGRKFLGQDPEIYKDLPVAMELRRTGQWTSFQFNSFLNDKVSHESQFKTWENARKMREGNREDNKIVTQAQFDAQAAYRASNWFDSKSQLAGITDANGLHPKIAQYIEQTQNGERPNDPQQIAMVEQQLAAGRKEVETQLYKDANRGGINSPAAIMGPEETKKRIDSKLALFDANMDAIHNDKFGLMTFNSRMAKAYTDTMTLNGLNSDQGSMLAKLHVINTMAGPQFTATLAGTVLLKATSDATKNWLGETTTGLIAPVDPRIKGQFNNYKDAAADAQFKKQYGVDPGTAVNSILDLNKYITDKTVSDPIKASIAAKAFDPNSKGFVGLMKTDTQFGNYSKMVNDDMTNEVWRLSRSDHKLWDHYTDWAQSTVGRELLGNALQDLNKFKESGMGISWDSENHKLTLLDKDGRTLSPEAKQMLSRGGLRRYDNASLPTPYQDVIDNVNRALKTLEPIQKHNGTDPNAYFLEQLKNAGFNPNNDPMQKGTALDRMGYAVAKSTLDTVDNAGRAVIGAGKYIAQDMVKDGVKAVGRGLERLGDPNNIRSKEIMNYDEAPQQANLSQWLQNPGGGAPTGDAFEQRKQELIKEEAQRSGTMTRRSTMEQEFKRLSEQGQ